MNLVHTFSALHRAAAAAIVIAPALASATGACGGRGADGGWGWAMPAHVMMMRGDLTCSGWVGGVWSWVAVAEVRDELSTAEFEALCTRAG